MSMRTHYVMLAHYHRWATRRVLASVGKLTETDASSQNRIIFPNLPSTVSYDHPVLRDMHLPCGSIYNTLCHLYFAEKLWMARITGQIPSDDLNNLWAPTAPTFVWQDAFAKEMRLPSLSALPADAKLDEESKYVKRALTSINFALDDMNNDWLELTKGTEEKSLFVPIEYTETSGIKRKRTRSTLYTHIFNHATHHRSQLATALTQNGVEYPVLDLTAFLPEWEELHAKAFRWA